MPIGLTAKIEPKNDGFVGMVDADQIIGASGAGGYLPSSTISGNSIQEYQIKISNTPSDGYFLQYKDSTDKLTWAETSTTDVAWSGASEFYPVSSLVHVLNIWYSNSSNKYSKAYISTSTGVFALSTHSHDEFGLWSGASEYISVSSNVNTLLNWYSNSSSKLSNAFASAAIALYSETYSSEDDLTSILNDNYANSGAFHSHITNEDNPHNVVWADVETGAKDDLADDYYPSSLGHSLSGSYHDHISDTSIHYSKDSISIEDLSDVAVMTPTDGKALIWDDTQSKWSSQTVSTSDVAWSGASDFYGFSSNTQSLYHPSGLVISGQEYSQAYASAQRVKDLFDSTLYSLSSNLYNQTWIDSLSGSINSRLEDLEDNVEFLPENYITSSSAIARFTDSSNLNRTYVDTVSGNLSDRIDAIDDTPNTWGVLTAGTGIDTLTNVGVSGAGETITVLGYSTISSQAKQAYDFSSASDLFNHEDYIYSSTAISRFSDSSSIQTKFLLSGVIYNALSSQSISSNIARVTDIYISDWDLNSANDHTVRDWFRLVQSPGWLSGGTVYHVSTNSNTSPPTLYITISGGQGLLREEDNDFAKEYFISWPTSSNIPITASAPKEYGIEWNSGDPKVKLASPGYAWDLDTEWPIGMAVNRSGSICFTRNEWSVRDPITNVIERFDAMGRVVRDEQRGGLILGESGDGNRYVTVTAGRLWTRLNEHEVSSQAAGGGDFDTSNGTDTFVVFIRKPGGGYTVLNQAETQWDHLNYDNNGTLTDIGNNDFGVQWFYSTTDGTINMIYNDSEYNTSADAENASPPSSLPICLEYGGILLGRIIFEGGAENDTAVEVQSAFSTTFTPAQAADHGNLSGLDDDDHTQYHNDTRGDARYYTQAQITTLSGNILSNVRTNYAPSSLTKSRYDEYVGHSGNTNIHFTVDSIRDDFTASSQVNRLLINSISSNLDTRIDSLFSWSSNALDLYGASSHTHDDRYYTETEIDNNFYTQTWIDTLSGSIDDRLDALEGASEITWLSLETLSSNATDAYNWVNASSQRYESILASGNEYSTNYSWYDTYHTQLENYLASGDEYSTNYTWYNTNHDGLDSLLASGNEYSSAYASTSTGVFALATHTHTTFGLWSGASEFYAFSSNVKDDLASLFAYSTTSYNNTEINAISSSIVTHVDNNFYNTTWIDSLSGSIDSRLDNLEDNDEFTLEDYITSTNAITRFADSSNYSTHKGDSTIHFTKASLDDDYTGSSNVNITTITNISSAIVTHVSNNYYDTGWIDTFSGNVDTRIDAKQDALDGSEYYPSSLGHSQYLEYVGHSSNTNNPHEVAWSDVSTDAKIDLADEFYPSSLGNTNITSLFNTSSAHKDRLDTLEAIDEFDHEFYITSSNAISRFVESGGTKWTDLTDGGETTLHTHAGMTTDVAWSGASEFYVVSSLVNTLDAWYDASSSKLSASGALAHNRVTLTGQDYLTLSDQEITVGKLDMEDTNLTDGLGITFATNDISVTDYIASSVAVNKFYYQESDLTAVLNDNYPGSSNVNWTKITAISSGFDGRLDALEGANGIGDISWTTPTAGDGISLDGTTGMVSGALTIKVDDDSITQAMLKSGSEYWSAYLSGQSAVNEATSPLSIAGTTISIQQADTDNSGYLSDTDWDTFNDKQDALDGSEYYPSSLGHNQYLEYVGHSSNTNNPHEVAWSDVSTAAIADLNDNYAGSSNINLSLLNSISSNLRTDIDAINDTPTNWGTLTAGTGISPITNVGISGSGDHDVTVLGYATISSQAKSSYNWITSTSGQIFAYPSSLGHSLMDFSSNAHNIFETKLTWVKPQEGTGIDFSTANWGVSGTQPTITINQGEILTTVSSNALNAYNWTNSVSGSYLAYPSSIGVGTSGTVASLVSFSSNAKTLYTTSSQVNRNYIDNVSSNALAAYLHSSSFIPHPWKYNAGDIYYASGEVRVGHSGFDCGDYNFQVSGDTFLSGTVLFKGSQISGISTPLYPSSCANKQYVDDNSSYTYFKVLPQDDEVVRDESRYIHFSGMGSTYVYSGAGQANTIIISSAVAGTGTVDISGSPVDNDWARFTDENTIEGLSNAETIVALGVVLGSTISSNFFLQTSGNTIWSWYSTSGVNLYDISTNLNTKISAVSDTPSTWGVITAGTGIDSSAAIGVSGAGSTLTVNQGEILTTVSSNAKSAYDWFTESSQKLSTISGSLSDRIDALEGASEITWLSLATVSSAAIDSDNWIDASSQRYEDLLSSGSKYSKAYASAQIAIYEAGGTPGGDDTQVQFNDGGAFGGDTSLTWNKTTNTLKALHISSQTISGGTIWGMTHSGNNAYFGDVYGKVHYSDLVFKEYWCDVCKETFDKGDMIILIAKKVTDELYSVPVHLKCALSKEGVNI